ncbi:hypothetical protein GCM10007938_01380 [Vibrio zhanjiangensis]|uniref:Uncharacterized protein n=1 Tax=Vibrio zhanjiangensis TaxID=1046128 RepID=A0ABQ6EUY4_9VIBR|nr:hypothetical protein [Vibrio zhanjiangensis]GLT16362.1 hypothetical protein GCM10007938_01380 [Vibrio zhanjiangensis]
MTNSTSKKTSSEQPLDITYDQIPWYRRRWFLAVTMLLFMPLTVILIFTGDIYLKRQGNVYEMQPSQKVMILVACFSLMFINFLRFT